MAPGETPASALARELVEELGIRLETDSIRYLYTVVGPAYSQPGEVEPVCFAGSWAGEPQACAEISAIAWLTLGEAEKFAPAVQQLCTEHLHHG
ncbi:NUDIX domain-containing protein [Crenobacter caeni]|uniref:NUDIX domain-containing protein n=1 Tax=Crenobacter caeni TaxID=2705474 RepID=UPI0032C3DB71